MGLRSLLTGSRTADTAVRAKGPWRSRAPHLLAATGFILLFAGIGTVAIRLSLGAPADDIPTAALPDDQTDTIVVQYKVNADQADLQERYDENNAVQTKTIGKLRTHVIKVPKSKRQAVIQDLAKDPNIQAAEQIQYGHAEATTPNDPQYANQAFWVKIGANQVWDTVKGDAKVILADIDTGVYANHPDIKPKLMAGYDFVESDQTPQDTGNGHGTAVAGVMAAATNNGIGVAGGCWNCMIMPLRVLDGNGAGSDATVAQAIQYAVDHGAQILNLSLSFADDSTVLKTAIDYAASHNALVIAAAGNQAGTAPRYPAAYPSVLSVAGTEADDTLSSESNYGSTVDMAAPGVSIFSTLNADAYAAWTGTSFASPIVAAVAGLLKSAYPSASVADLRAAITTTTDPCCSNKLPAGRINAVKANAYLAAKFPPADKTGPTVAIGVPAANATVKGGVSITATAEDPSGVAKVEFKIDNGQSVVDTSLPYSYTWNTIGAANGTHTITVTAYDTLGNQTQATRTVTVANTTTTRLAGDINGDGKVTINDLSLLLNNWGKTTSVGDVNGDGKVTINDLSILLNNWGRSSAS